MKKRKKNTQKPETGHAKTKVTQVEVDNPFFNRDHAQSSGNQKREKVSYNMLESPIAMYYARADIKVDDAMKKAGDRFRYLFETAQGNGVAAFDYTQIFVDGGQPSDNMSERRTQALSELADIHQKLGDDYYKLVEQVCGQCIFISVLFGKSSRPRKRAMDNLIDALNILAKLWEFTGRLSSRT